MKICCVASSGGHWEELMCLQDIFCKYDCVFVTEMGEQAEDSNLKALYKIPQINRREKFFYFILLNFS